MSGAEIRVGDRPRKRINNNMKSLIAVIALALVSMTAFAKDKKEYQVGVLQKHTQDTQRVGTDFSGIQCDNDRCVGSAAGIYQTNNWWDIRIDGGYWELQPNWQDNSKYNPLNTAKEGDKILFRMAKRHYLNGTADVAYLPRTDDPDKEVMLMAKWVPDHPVATAQPQQKSQLEVACETGKLTPDQQKQYCGKPEQVTQSAAPSTPAAPTPAPTAAASPMDQFKAMCESGMFKPGRDDVAIQQCNITFPKKATDPAVK